MADKEPNETWKLRSGEPVVFYGGRDMLVKPFVLVGAAATTVDALEGSSRR